MRHLFEVQPYHNFLKQSCFTDELNFKCNMGGGSRKVLSQKIKRRKRFHKNSLDERISHMTISH